MFRWLRTLFSQQKYSFDHFTDAVEDVKQLKRDHKRDEAEELLLWCIEQAKQDGEFSDPPPWYYKQLAIIYRKDERYDKEVSILERYLDRTENPRSDVVERLQRAEKLAA